MQNYKSIFRFLLLSVSIPIISINIAYAQQDSTASDSISVEDIRRQLQQEEREQGQQNESLSASQRTRTTATSRNPEISAIGDFRSLYTDAGDRNWDAYVQGIELNFSSAIDPYAKAEFYPVFEGEGGELNAKIEEVYLQTLSLPLNLQLKAGKFRQAFGRINTVHRHALPVIDVPIAYESFFGEALIDQGASLSWLIPNPKFYQELIIDVTRGAEESPLFAYSDNNQPQLMGHLKNFWDLSENSTLELGVSGALGDNELGEKTRIGGVDLTYKWKPIQFNTYQSFEWQTEFYFSEYEELPTQQINAWGMYSWMQYQLSKRWFVTGMYSYSEKPADRTFEEQAISATFGWYGTEFQKLEIGPKIRGGTGFSNATFSGLFRWVFVIGSHGAHQY
ncbi:hypothetical protein [Fodinibius sp. SL11]|uniref:hypothetical protein n=1 Tax=Fodinibius sp. SL11 TaxID=3425690 RepID=UPI003F882137